jgi:hypothetical protein
MLWTARENVWRATNRWSDGSRAMAVSAVYVIRARSCVV